jgi:adenylate cyclase
VQCAGPCRCQLCTPWQSPTWLFAGLHGPPKPCADTLADHAALKLGEGAGDLKHEPPGRRGRVNRLLVEVQIDAASLQLLNCAKEIDQRAAEPIAGWALPVSITLGAVFGHFQAQNASVWGYVQGAAAAIVISCTILLLEFAVFSRTRSALARRMPFLLYLALRSLGYLAATLMGLAVSAWLLRESAERPLIERGGVVFSLVLSLGFNLLFGVNDLLGQGVLFNFVAGRYRRPRVEDRVLLFIDMESSTVIAERLGEARFLDFLNRFVADVTESIVAQRGAIHKYVGDEIIVTWPLAAGLRDGHCVHACFDALEQLDERAKAYIRDFGLRANFRAALHCGPVAIGELGTIKMEIAFLGDTMNTAARLQQACRDTGQRVLASAALVNRLAALPPGIAKRSIGWLRLRGKENEIELYALAAAVSATSASDEITALSSRLG